MKKLIVLIGLMVAVLSLYAQTNSERELRDFTKITVGDRVNLHLIKGDQPHIRLESYDINFADINAIVRNGHLHIYLDGAKMFDKREYYRNRTVDAYVTFVELEKLVIKGDGFIECEDDIVANKFTLKVYGDNDVRLAGLYASKMVTKAYGDNDIIIENGTIAEQKFKLYGENQINTLNIASREGKVSIFGESDVRLSAEHQLNYNIFGDADIRFSGNPRVRQGIVMGEKSVYQYTDRRPE
ncbi:MAG: DUF2807 domain-containing protein [Bacteroidota bacterium]